MKGRDIRGVVAGLCLLTGLAFGCGDDDDDSSGDAGRDGGDEAGRGGTGGGGGAGAGGASGRGGTGGSGGSGMMGAECDPAIMEETSCGGAACPPLTSQFAGAVCAITCCTDDNQCGTRRAYAMTATQPNGPTDCALPAVPDPNCPDYMTGMGMGAADEDGGMAGNVFPGCCTAAGVCGVITTTDMSCITSSPLLPDLMPGPPCGVDETDAGM